MALASQGSLLLSSVSSWSPLTVDRDRYGYDNESHDNTVAIKMTLLAIMLPHCLSVNADH